MIHPVGVPQLVSKIIVPGRYRTSAGTATSTGATRKSPACRPRMLPKTLGESKRGTHIHSTEPAGDINADTSPSLMNPKSPIGVDRRCETGLLIRLEFRDLVLFAMT
jgi:hypothetical protein